MPAAGETTLFCSHAKPAEDCRCVLVHYRYGGPRRVRRGRERVQCAERDEPGKPGRSDDRADGDACGRDAHADTGRRNSVTDAEGRDALTDTNGQPIANAGAGDDDGRNRLR